MSEPHPVRTFGAKLTRLLVLTSAVAVVVVCALWITMDVFRLRRLALTNLYTQADIIAIHSTAALAFNDPEAGKETLQALRAEPQIAAADLYDEAGTPFASYRHGKRSVPRLSPNPAGSRFDGRWLLLVRPVVFDQQRIGTLTIAYDMSNVYNRLLTNGAVSLLAGVAATVIALLLALRLERILERPVAALSETAATVSRTKDYSLRAPKFSDDELGRLTDVFNEMLEQIGRQNSELQRAREAAENASRMKDEFLATVSHELRTPLNAILGWAQLLSRGAVKGPEMTNALETIERNARLQTRLVEDLLDTSRIITGKLRIEVQRVEPAPVLEAAIESVTPTAEAKGVRIQRVIDAGTGPVSGDPARLQQVFWNLLTNAVKFTPRGGRVQVVLERVNSHIEISVSDTGQGIKPEFVPHVFEAFRQEDGTLARRHGGLGLGLAIAKHLTELHGGHIAVRSAGEGKGTTFTVSLPLRLVHGHDPQVALGGTGGADAARPSLKGVRVLVVDDAPDAVTLARRVLEDAQAEVITAASAEEGMTVLRREEVDVLVSDIGMPEHDGYEFIQQVRRDASEPNRHVPAAALTALARPEDRTRAINSGYQAHLAKPVEAGELVAVVASLAKRR